MEEIAFTGLELGLWTLAFVFVVGLGVYETHQEKKRMKK